MVGNLDRHRRNFFDRFPEAEHLEKALKSAKNNTPLFFFYESTDPDLKKSWLVLGRLGPEMEASLSINGEVLFLFTPHEEFQRRSFNKLTDAARQEIIAVQQQTFGVVRFTPDPHIALVYSRDPSLGKNLKAWNADRPSSLVAGLPIPSAQHDRLLQELRRSIATVLASRDLYGGKNPVSGRDFFGRLHTIKSISAELRNGRSVGLFGLRRSGKTSVLRELQYREESSGLALILSDLESIDTVNDIPRQISHDLLDVLRRMRAVETNVWTGPEAEHEVATFGALSTRLIRVAQRNASLRFVVAVDEVENLSRLSRESPQSVRLFLGSLRRASQATRNLSLFFTGVTTHFFDQSMIDDEIDNPLFGFIDSHFLPPFAASESAELIRDLGRLMMLEWSDDALATVHGLTGGFPFFVRDLSSAVRGVALAEVPDEWRDAKYLEIHKHHVMHAFNTWNDGAGKLWQEILRTLKSYQPIMAEMTSADSGHEVQEWRRIGVDGETAASALMKLGLLVAYDDMLLHQSPSLVALNDLGTKSKTPVSEIESRRDLRTLLRRPESIDLEFKSTARWNLRIKAKDSAVEDAVAKTVAAFLNTEGGTLIIGVADSGELIGILDDLATCRNSLDQYERWLVGDLLGGRIGTEIVSQHVRYSTTSLDGHILVVLTVRKFDGIAWVSSGGEEALYVRNGNETRQLKGRQAVEFARTR